MAVGAMAIGGVVGIGVAITPPSRAHTCTKITSGDPPTTTIIGGLTCDVGHHPNCFQQPLNGGSVVVCPGP